MSQSHDAWVEVGEQLKAVGSRIRENYVTQEASTRTEPPSREELEDAAKTFGDSVVAALGTVGDALKDTEVTSGAKEAVARFFDALGVTFAELGADLARGAEHEAEEHPDPSGDDER